MYVCILKKIVALITLVTSAAPMLMPHVAALTPSQRRRGKAEERCAVPPVQWIKEGPKKVQGGGGKGACISIRACVWLREEAAACPYKLRWTLTSRIVSHDTTESPLLLSGEPDRPEILFPCTLQHAVRQMCRDNSRPYTTLWKGLSAFGNRKCCRGSLYLSYRGVYLTAVKHRLQTELF